MSFVLAANAPTFDNNFKKHMLTDPNGTNETVYNPTTFKVSANSSLKQNIYNLFSPTNNSSVIWVTIRIVMVGVLVLYFVWTGINFILDANDEGKLKATKRSFIYMLLGAFLIYTVTWVLGKALAIDNVGWSSGIVNSLITRIMFQILGFLKAFAFFYAIVMTIRYGIQFMKALEKEDQIKTAKKGITNVLMSLIFIKVIDFIYFIAQSGQFVSKAKNFMLNIARVWGYLLGAGMVVALIYAGYKYISAQGDEKEVGQAKKTIISIFYVILILFLFLLVAWQLIAEFA
jgi:hypothetical protein